METESPNLTVNNQPSGLLGIIQASNGLDSRLSELSSQSQSVPELSSETLKAKRKEVQSLKDQLKGLSQQIVDYKTSRERELLMRQDYRIVAELKSLMDENPEMNRGYIAVNLAGIGTAESMDIRWKLLEEAWARGDDSLVQNVALGLVGVGTEEAMEMRRELLNDERLHAIYIAQSLGGVGTEEAIEMRRELIKILKQHQLRDVLVGLAGVDNDESMELRKEILRGGADPTFVVESLAGIGSPESIDLRKQLLEKGANVNNTSIGLVGVGTPESIELRNKLLIDGASKTGVACSLAGVDNQEIRGLRNSLFMFSGREYMLTEYALLGLAGVGSEQSMRERTLVLEAGADIEYVARSLAGVNTDEAFEFRRKYFGDNPELFAQSFTTGELNIDSVVCRYGWENDDTT